MRIVGELSLREITGRGRFRAWNSVRSLANPLSSN
ncbi:hypothetical protein HF265_21650 [Rhizobium leguminosarum]|nr:helix-turn-helix domain-containing protein [Rhizobium leguminosarum]MBY3031658.1 hypothetical protein [Rhizobium leguminosarum]